MSFLYTNGTDYVCFLGWVLTNVIQIMSVEGKKERKKERLSEHNTVQFFWENISSQKKKTSLIISL